MATSSTSDHVERFKFSYSVPQSLRQVQLKWFVTMHQTQTSAEPSVHDDDVDNKRGDDVGGRLTLQLSIIDHSSTAEHREWICQRAVRENVEDIYDVPSDLLHVGHRYEFNVKLMSVGDNDSSGLMTVLSTKTCKFHAGMHFENNYYS